MHNLEGFIQEICFYLWKQLGSFLFALFEVYNLVWFFSQHSTFDFLWFQFYKSFPFYGGGFYFLLFCKFNYRGSELSSHEVTLVLISTCPCILFCCEVSILIRVNILINAIDASTPTYWIMKISLDFTRVLIKYIRRSGFIPITPRRLRLWGMNIFLTWLSYFWVLYR